MSERFPLSCSRPRVCTPVGNALEVVHRLVRPPHGAPYLEEAGTQDLQSLIQSFKDECDIQKLVQRYEAGDFTVLQRVQGIYTDVSGMPENLTEAFSSLEIARNTFDSLPDDRKSLYDSFESFLADPFKVSSDLGVSDSVSKEVDSGV